MRTGFGARAFCAALIGVLTLPAAAAFAVPQNVVITDGKSGPECISVLSDGTVLAAGQNRAVIFRARPGEKIAQEWIVPRSGATAITHGVMPDERAGVLWTNLIEPASEAKGAPRLSTLLALDLKTGQEKARYAFPEPRTFFNDVSLAPDGTPYMPDSTNARIMRLNPKTGRIEVWAQDSQLLAQPNGLAFLGSTLYVGVHRGDLMRIPLLQDGSAGPITAVKLSRLLERPDGMRAAGPNRIVVAEVVDNIVKDGPKGRGTLVTIDGDSGAVETLKDRLWAPSAAGANGDTAYFLESKLGFHSDPAMLGQDPGPLTIYAVPLPAK